MVEYSEYFKMTFAKILDSGSKLALKLPKDINVGLVFPMVMISILHHAEFGRNDHRKDALHSSND